MNAGGVLKQAMASERSAIYIELTKPRITLMVLVTVAMGQFLASAAAPQPALLLHALIGAALACSGAGALNQYIERDTDSLMNRTRFRPLPAQKVSPMTVVALGTALAIGGVAYTAVTVNTVAAAINALTVATYLFVYTPMKRHSSLSTLAGAVPGALPPVIGWAAVDPNLGAGGWILFGIVFLWQIPHFLAIARLYRDDYASGGFPMLAVMDDPGDLTGRMMVLYAAALVPVSSMLVVAGVAGTFYLFAALALGAAYTAAAVVARRDETREAARRLLLTSVAYLPLLFAALVIDRWFGA